MIALWLKVEQRADYMDLDELEAKHVRTMNEASTEASSLAD